MASHDSAIKAHRQNLVKREANRQYRARLRGALRAIRTAIDSGDPARVKDALRDTISLVDKMAGKKVIHRNADHWWARAQNAGMSKLALDSLGPRMKGGPPHDGAMSMPRQVGRRVRGEGEDLHVSTWLRRGRR